MKKAYKYSTIWISGMRKGERNDADHRSRYGKERNMSEVRLIDANAYAAEMKERQDALKEGSE